MDCSPPGSSVHGIFQARILEMVTISYSRGLILHLLYWQANSSSLSHLGSPEEGDEIVIFKTGQMRQTLGPGALGGPGGSGWGGRWGGIRMGKTCEPKAFSFQCMTKFTTNKKKKKKMKKKKRARTFLNQIVSLPWGLPSHPMVRTLELPLLRVTWSGN